MNTWIFQSNPIKFDIDTYLDENKSVNWTLRQKHFEKKITLGDEVYIWRSDGDIKNSGGIIAKAIVIGIECPRNVEDSKEYWKTEEWSNIESRVDLTVLEVRKDIGMIKRTNLLNYETLENLRILKVRNETNYLLTIEQAKEINTLWENSKPNIVSFPPLKISSRDREFKKYPQVIRDKIAFFYLFEGKTPRWLDENIIGVSADYSRGWQAMGILHHLGLVEAHKGIFQGLMINTAIYTLRNFNDAKFERIAQILERYSLNLYDDNLQLFKPLDDTYKLIKQIGTSQYTDGVRIDKAFHDVFNPPNSPFYTERGIARPIKVLFNNKVFNADYRFEDQEDKTIVLQSIRFKKELKEEFKKVFPYPDGEFIIQQGVDANHFVFTFSNTASESVIIDEDETDYPEGATAYRTHKVRERNPKVVKKAKQLFMNKNKGKLFCEACGFNFLNFYGERGLEFIEGHHKKLVSQMEEGEKTNVEDIALLCSNCHRMIHKKPQISVEELSKLIRR